MILGELNCLDRVVIIIITKDPIPHTHQGLMDTVDRNRLFEVL